jgi:hypothetical protein
MTKELTEVEAVAKAIYGEFVKALISCTNTKLEETSFGWRDWIVEATAAIEAHKAHLSASGRVIVPREMLEKIGDMATEHMKLKYAADCKCGQCQLVPLHRLAILSALSDKEG